MIVSSWLVVANMFFTLPQWLSDSWLIDLHIFFRMAQLITNQNPLNDQIHELG